jgi:hypothetical protein
MDFPKHITIDKDLYVRADRTNTSILYRYPEKGRVLKCFLEAHDCFFFDNYKEVKALVNSISLFPKILNRVDSTPYGKHNYIMENVDWWTHWGAIAISSRLYWVYFLIKELKILWDEGYIYKDFKVSNLLFDEGKKLKLLGPDHIDVVPVNSQFKDIYKWSWILENESGVLYNLYEPPKTP